MSFVWQLSGNWNAIKLKPNRKLSYVCKRAAVCTQVTSPALHLSLFLSLSRFLALSSWMKRSRRIPFPSSEPGKWRGSLLYVGREEELSRTTTRHCSAAGVQESATLERMDGPPKCCAETLNSAFRHTPQRSVIVCIWQITKHGDVLNSRRLKP